MWVIEACRPQRIKRDVGGGVGQRELADVERGPPHRPAVGERGHDGGAGLSSSATGRPVCSSSAKVKAVEVVTPVTSADPAMTSGRTSPMITMIAMTRNALPIDLAGLRSGSA